MYSNKVNGHAFAGEFLGANLQFYVLTTAVDISGTTPASQATLDKLVEIISLNGQPVIFGAAAGANGTYTIRFANEHTNAWGVDGSALVAAIKQHAPVQFASDATLAVTFVETL